MDNPIVAIFVRHSKGCPHAADELSKECNCRKHLRWSIQGRQYRKTAGTRSWKQAEEARSKLIVQLSRDPDAGKPLQTITDAIVSFMMSKAAEGLAPNSLSLYKRDLARLQTFADENGCHTVTALTLEVLIAFRDTWKAFYTSSYSRAVSQKRLKTFLNHCYNAGWLARVPKLSPIKISEPETEPLTADQYTRLVDAVQDKPKLRALIQLMRHSGLAVQDASTLKRSALDFNKEKNLYRIISSRVKTGSNLYIPLPPDVAAELLRVANGNETYIFWDKRCSGPRQSRFASEDIAAAFDAAGIKSEGHMISHRLRATFAVDLLQKGVPLEHVSKLLGHNSVTTTERHYARWVQGRQDLLDSLVSETW